MRPAQPRLEPGKNLLWWIKKGLVWAIWIGVGCVIIPVARRKNVSAFKWYFLGLGAFYGPFLAITYGPIFLSVLIDRDPHNRWFLRGVLESIGILATAGFGAGLACLYKVRAKLSRLPGGITDQSAPSARESP